MTAVYDGAQVVDKARVFEDARIFENAGVGGAAKLYGKAQVYGAAGVSGNAKVHGKAKVYEEGRVEDDAEVSDNAQVYGNLAMVYGEAQVFGDAQVTEMAEVFGLAWVGKKAIIRGEARVHGKAEVSGKAKVSDNATVEGDAVVAGDAIIGGTARVTGNARVTTGYINWGTLTTGGALDEREEEKEALPTAPVVTEVAEEMTGDEALGEFLQRGLRAGRDPSASVQRFVGAPAKQKDIFASMRQYAQSEVQKEWDDNPKTAKQLIDRSHKLWDAYYERPLKKNLVAFDRHLHVMSHSKSARVKQERTRALRASNREWKARGWKRPAKKRHTKR